MTSHLNISPSNQIYPNPFVFRKTIRLVDPIFGCHSEIECRINSRIRSLSTNVQNGSSRHVCIVNVGLFRSGTTTLTEAAKCLGLKPYREFPDLLQDELNDFLHKFTRGGDRLGI